MFLAVNFYQLNDMSEFRDGELVVPFRSSRRPLWVYWGGQVKGFVSTGQSVTKVTG